MGKMIYDFFRKILPEFMYKYSEFPKVVVRKTQLLLAVQLVLDAQTQLLLETCRFLTLFPQLLLETHYTNDFQQLVFKIKNIKIIY